MDQGNLAIKGPIRLPVDTKSGAVVDMDFHYANGRKTRYIVLSRDVHGSEWPLLRIESACTFGHVFGSRRCDCGYQLETAIDLVSKNGGMVIYGVDEDGRGLGLEGHFDTYVLRQIQKMDTEDVYKTLKKEMDERDYSDVPAILRHLGVNKVTILTNNSRRLDFLERSNIEYKRQPLERIIDKHSALALMEKKDHLHYMFSFKSHLENFAVLKEKNVAAPGEIAALIVRDFESSMGFSIPENGPDDALRTAIESGAHGSETYNILYLTRCPSPGWITSLEGSNVHLIVIAKQGISREHLAQLSEVAIPLDTIHVD